MQCKVMKQYFLISFWQVKSFSQFNNDFASVETFFLLLGEGGDESPPPSDGPDLPPVSRAGRRSQDPAR